MTDKQASVSLLPNGNMKIVIPMTFRRVYGRKTVVTPPSLEQALPQKSESAQPAMVQALARAFAWAGVIEQGRGDSIAEIARRLRVSNSYVEKLITLVNLAPDIVEAIMNGEEPQGLSLTKLCRSFPEDWAEQRRLFGFE
jgi:hypothetical protein